MLGTEVVSHNNRQVPLMLLCLHVSQNGQQYTWLCHARGRCMCNVRLAQNWLCNAMRLAVPAAGKTVATVETAGGYTDTSPPRDNGDQSGIGLSFGDASLDG